MKDFPRTKEKEIISEIFRSNKSEFVYVRGRRRVGKSWLLQELPQLYKNCFIFTGSKDSSELKTKQKFLRSWAEFSRNRLLSKVNAKSLSWQDIFEEISEYQINSKATTILIFDEIQWISKQGSGFIGDLKTAWVRWQKTKHIKVIVCGSSNKFFAQHVGGEEKILRGIQTRPELWIHPLSPKEMKAYVCPNWSLDEATLLYMLTGGVPYYYENLDPKKGFIHAINDAYFCANSNLLNEVDEMLSLEFNSQGKVTSRKILGSLGITGRSFQRIVEITGLAKSTISENLDNLELFSLVKKKYSGLEVQKHKNYASKYYINDYYLSAYFQIFEKLAEKIKLNTKGLIFPTETKLSKNGYYIPDFTGETFEFLVRQILANRVMFANAFYDKLLIKSPAYEIYDRWSSILSEEHQTQVDLIVKSEEDRLIRLIECKWGNWKKEYIDQILNLEITLDTTLRKRYSLIKVIITNAVIPKSDMAKFERAKVVVIGLEDLFT